MKIPASFIITLIFALHTHHCRGQSPLHFKRDTLHVNFDTTGANTTEVFQEYNLSRFFMAVDAVNTGRDTISLTPDSPHELMPARLAPAATGTIYLYKKNNLPANWPLVRNKSQAVAVSFMYKNKKKQRSLWLDITFGKSALVEVTAPVQAMDSLIAQKFRRERAINPALTFDLFKISLKETIQIRNRSGKALIVPEKGIAYNDWGGQLYYREAIGPLKSLSAGQTFSLPVTLNMDRRKRFRVGGYLIVYSPDYSDIAIFFTKFSSNYSPGNL